MPAWNDILNELKDTPSQADYVRRKYIRKLSEAEKRCSKALIIIVKYHQRLHAKCVSTEVVFLWNFLLSRGITDL